MRNEKWKITRKTIVWHVIISILPFLMFFWMIPFVSDRTLGNDYPRFSIDHQMELMFSVKTGSFPLYVPGFAGGQSASALTQAQIFHPISHIAGLMPGYWSGKSLEWITFLRLLLLGGAHMALFGFLRRLKLSNFMAFLLSAVTAYNLRMLDLFRYGASFESWTGHLFLCVAIGRYCLKPTKFQGPLLIIGLTYCLVCSGHPQMMYYGLLGAGLFMLVIPYFLAMMLPEREMTFRMVLKFWLGLGLCLGAGILLSSAYVFPFYFDFVTGNAGRVGRGYAWADTYRDTFIGTLNNFFYPLRSDVHGVFGGSSLFLAAIMTPVLRLFRVSVPRVVWTILGLILLIFMHIQGSGTPVHYLVWKYFPLASSFRVPGRISLIMPIFFMLVLAWAIRTEPFRVKLAGRDILIVPQTIIAATAFLMTVAYACVSSLMTNIPDPAVFSPSAIREIPLRMDHAALAAGMLTLAALAVHGLLSQRRFMAELLLCLTVCAQIMGLLYYGTWVQTKNDKPSFEQMLAQKRQKLEYHADLPGFGLGTEAVMRQARRSYLEPFLGKVYTRYLSAEDNDNAYALMKQGRTYDQVVLEGYTPLYYDDKPQPSENATHQAKLTYSSFNRLVFDVSALAFRIF